MHVFVEVLALISISHSREDPGLNNLCVCVSKRDPCGLSESRAAGARSLAYRYTSLSAGVHREVLTCPGCLVLVWF